MPLWASGYRNLLPNRRRMYEGAGGPPGISYYVDATSGSDAYDGVTRGDPPDIGAYEYVA